MLRSVCALVLTLLLCALGSAPVTGQDADSEENTVLQDMTIAELRVLYARRVLTAERVQRLKQGVKPGTKMWYGNSHSGVRVTLEGTPHQYLIHKGPKYSGWFHHKTVITDTRNMRQTGWTVKETRDFGGSVTVNDMIRAGGGFYLLLGANCHDAAKAIMRL
ncbi:hypothetical protein WMY93_030543 [Mugilogobius chulae]|uniref:Uncharacterized protein n=1 Tax=Mugilogobius chulae TaxID=88201 RepID=A0AAW0MI20_9GOBI